MADGLEKFLNGELAEPFALNYPLSITCDLQALGVDPESLANPMTVEGRYGQPADGHLSFDAIFTDKDGHSRPVRVEIVDWASPGGDQTSTQKMVADYSVSVIELDAEPLTFDIETSGNRYPRTQITRKRNSIELKIVPASSEGLETVFYRMSTGTADIYFGGGTEFKEVNPFDEGHGLSESLRESLSQSLGCGYS